MRILIAAALSTALGGCVTSTAALLERQDAATDQEIEGAVADVGRVLADRRKAEPLRLTAAKVLGRLTSAQGASVLGGILLDPSESDALRSYAAWALGELRDPRSLEPLIGALRAPLGDQAGERVLEGIAKHAALLAGNDDRLLELTEAMVYFAGQRSQAPPAVYDLLSARTRTLPVSLKVLDHATKQAIERRGEAELAALYQATFELLSRLEGSRAEITARGDAWKTRIEESLRAAQRVFETGDPAATLLVIASLGRLGDLPEIGREAGAALVGGNGDRPRRPTVDARTGMRLVAAWALARMKLHSLGARHALLFDVLTREATPAVLEVIADQAAPTQTQDDLQKLLEVEVKEPAP